MTDPPERIIERLKANRLGGLSPEQKEKWQAAMAALEQRLKGAKDEFGDEKEAKHD